MSFSGGAVGAADERRHPGVEEVWWFDFTAGSGSGGDGPGSAGGDWVGGYVRLAFRPADGVAWFWAAAVGDGLALVTLRAHDIPIPTRGTDIRADGVWASLTCETPLEHWSVGLESFGVALDDPLAAWGDERGDVVPFGLELEWEAAAAAVGATAPGGGGGGGGYGQWCAVHGEVLIGDERIPIDGGGHREHRWGSVSSPWRVAASFPDGSTWWARDGWAVGERAGLVVAPAALETERDAGGLPVRAALTAGDSTILLVPTHHSPVAVPGSPVVHALCAVTQGDRGGRAWVSWA